MISADGKSLVTIGNGGTAKCCIGYRARIVSKSYESRYIYAAPVMSRDGKLLAHASDGMVYVREMATGNETPSQPGHLGPVSWLTANANGSQFLTGSNDGNLRVWDAASSRIIRTIPIPNSGVVAPRGELMDDGHTVAINADGRLRFWDVATGRESHPPDLKTEVPCAQLSVTAERTIARLHIRVTLVDWPSGKVRRRSR